jgi:hypothetical protein
LLPIWVARWFVFKPKLPILVKFGSLGIENVVIFYDHLEYFTAIWYNLQHLGIVCGHLEYFIHFTTYQNGKNIPLSHKIY